MAGSYATPYLKLLEGFPCGTLGLERFLLMSEETGSPVWSYQVACCAFLLNGIFPFWPAEGSIKTQNFLKRRTPLGPLPLYIKTSAEF